MSQLTSASRFLTHYGDEITLPANLFDGFSPEFITRFREDDDFMFTAFKDLEQFILKAEKVHYDIGALCLHLGTDMYRDQRYQKGGDDRFLLAAIDFGRVALAIYPVGHQRYASACAALSSSLRTRYDSTGDETLLDEAVNLARKALSFCPSGHPLRALMCANLANTLKSQYDTTNGPRIIVESIELLRESLSLQPIGSSGFAKVCGNLGTSLMLRYRITGDHHLLSEAIDLQRTCLSLCPPGHPDYGVSCMGLALSLKLGYSIAGLKPYLMEAIDLQQDALSFCSLGDPHRAAYCTNLAESLRLHYHNTGDEDLLNDAISLSRESLRLYPPGHPNHSKICHDVVESLMERYSSTHDEHILIEIHQLCTQSLPLDYPSERWYEQTNLARLHLQPDTKLFDVNAAIQYLSASLDHHPNSVSDAMSRIGLALKYVWNLADHNSLSTEHHINLVPVYQRLIRLLPFLTHPVLAAETQLRALWQFSQLGPYAFINAVLANKWLSGLETMESAQGILWSQRLNYQDPDLRLVPEPLAARLKSSLEALAISSMRSSTELDIGQSIASSSTLTYRDLHHNHATQVSTLLQEIREIPGLDHFMIGETAAALCSVSSTHPVVLLVGARKRAYAVILTPSNDHVVLPLNWNEDIFSDLSSEKQASRSHRGVGNPAEDLLDDHINRAMKMKATTSTPTSRRMRYLWVALVKPILDHLGIQPAKGRARPRLHWCPTGSFSALPLHAAGIYDGPADSQVYCADYVVSSYTPTLTSLLRVQKAMSPISKASSCIVLVAEKRAQESHLHEIPEVNKEIDSAATIAEANSVQTVHRISGSTTVSGTCAAIKEASIVHLACHGVQNAQQATKSGFCLGDGRLTISKLMEMKMDNAFLAFLSACETAKGDANQPDQTMHLAAAMLFTGFKTVVATMWAISDCDGPLVAQWFYQELFTAELIDADSVPYALDTAVGKLRQSGVSLDRWAPFIHIGA